MPTESRRSGLLLALIACVLGLVACLPADMMSRTALVATAEVFATANSVPSATSAPEVVAAPSEATALPSATTMAGSDDQSGLVLDVIDGDTIDVAVEGQILRVRYLGVDTPEQGSKSYLVAKDLNRSLVYMKQVRLERDVRDRDGYGRYLRHVYVGDVHVNVELLRSGWARLLVIPPNEKHADVMAVAQREAAQAERGLWQKPTPPAGN